MAARVILLLAVVYTCVITTLSLVQLGKISVGEFNPTDKMMHAGAHFVLALMWLLYYSFITKNRNLSGFFVISGSIVLFGMLIEVLQGTLTSYREPDWADILANTTGVIGALLLFVIFPNFINRVKHHINSFL